VRPSPVLPGVVAVVAVAGTGMGAVVLTSFGLMPLVGEPSASLDGWRAAAPELGVAARESLLVALPATALALLAGLLLAGVVLTPGRGARVVRTLVVVVLAVPHLAGAVSVGLLLGDGGLGARVLAPDGGWPALVGGPLPVATWLELAWKESAFVALVVVASVGPGHRGRSEVAASLGAGPLRRWTRVLVPSALPAAGASGLVVLVYGIGTYEVAWLLGRSYPEPLPVLAFRLFGSIDLGDRPAAAAAAATGSALALGLALCVLVAVPAAARALGPALAGQEVRR